MDNLKSVKAEIRRKEVELIRLDDELVRLKALRNKLTGGKYAAYQVVIGETALYPERNLNEIGRGSLDELIKEWKSYANSIWGIAFVPVGYKLVKEDA